LSSSANSVHRTPTSSFGSFYLLQLVSAACSVKIGKQKLFDKAHEMLSCFMMLLLKNSFFCFFFTSSCLLHIILYSLHVHRQEKASLFFLFFLFYILTHQIVDNEKAAGLAWKQKKMISSFQGRPVLSVLSIGALEIENPRRRLNTFRITTILQMDNI